MRLLTHNILQCNKKGVTNGYPLIIRPVEMKYEESAFDKDFTASMIPKIEYGALLKALTEVRGAAKFTGAEAMPEGGPPALPDEFREEYKSDDGFLRKLHVALFDLHLVEGKLVCPESGREFPVEKGIPNMLLNDDEV
mmetsp:Transcript_61951/g.108493  ORF Transcript_61951/g.108493 Transcript_61951/m.108493 type:complete len:138 (+) Transcript_61951:103-516(+)